MEDRWKEFRKVHSSALLLGLEHGEPETPEEVYMTLLVNISTELRVISEQLEELLTKESAL